MPEDIFDIDEVTVQTDIPENAIVNEYRSKITIGDVETLDYGEDAYVTNTGTAEDPVLNFGLPKGASGTLWGQLDGVLSDQTDLKNALDAKDTAIALKANIASPDFTGIPTAPTAADGTSTTQIATTRFVQNAISILNTTLTNYINSAVANVLKQINFSNAVSFQAANNGKQASNYTVPSNGYIYITAATSNTYVIQGKSMTIIGALLPISAGQVISSIVVYTPNTSAVSGFFLPQV